MRLEGIDRQQGTAHFISEQGEIIIAAQRLQGLFDQVMGGRGEKGAYHKDLRTAKDEVQAGVHNEILSNPLEKEAIYYYASNLLTYLRVSWFNIAGSAITDQDEQRLNALYSSAQQPQEDDSDSVKNWFAVFSLRKLLEEQNS